MFLSILDTLSVGEIGGIAALLLGLLWAIKTQLPKELTTTTSQLLEKRTVERDDALRKVAVLDMEVNSLEEEILLLRRELMQRMTIALQDSGAAHDSLAPKIKNLLK